MSPVAPGGPVRRRSLLRRRAHALPGDSVTKAARRGNDLLMVVSDEELLVASVVLRPLGRAFYRATATRRSRRPALTIGIASMRHSCPPRSRHALHAQVAVAARPQLSAAARALSEQLS